MSTTIPSNVEITSGISTAEQAIEETKKREKRLTPEGKEILETAEQLLEDSTRFIEEKNPDDLIQRIIGEAQKAGQELKGTQGKWNELQQSLRKLKSTELQNRLTRVYETSKYLALELVASSSFRQTFYDFVSVLYSCFIDASKIERIGQPIRQAIESSKQGLTEEARQEFKVAAEETARRVIDYKDPQKPVLDTSNLTKEQMDEMADRANDVLNNIAERERSHRLIANVIEVWDLLREPLEVLVRRAEVAGEKLSEKLETETMDEGTHLERVLILSQQLFEQMTGRSLGVFLSHLRVVYRTILDDPELKDYVTRLRRFFDSILADKDKATEILTQQQQRDKIRELIEEGQELMKKKEGSGEEKSLRENLRVCYEELQKMVEALEDDPLTRAIQEDINKLVSQILLDEKGQVTFKPDVLDQLRVIVTSLVLRRLKFPLPPLSVGEDDPNATLKFNVSGMVLNVRDLLPKQIIAENEGLAILDIKKEDVSEVRKAEAAVRIIFKNICVHLPDAYLKFDYRGFPAVQDEGNAYIDIGGKGMDITVVLQTQKESNRMLNLSKVDVTLHDLTLKLEGTRHDTLYNLFLTVFKPRIKTHIENALEDSLAHQFVQLNDMIAKQAEMLREKVPTAVQTALKMK